MPQFSIIVPTRDRLQLLQHTLNSIEAQTFLDYELIVIDDGSTDGSAEFLASYGKVSRVLTLTGEGASTARNAGIHWATGNYVVFLDSDDLWFPWTLDVLNAVIVGFDDPSLVINRIHFFRYANTLESVQQEPLATSDFSDYYASVRDAFYVSASMLTVKRSLLKASSGFDSRLVCAEDHDLVLRLGLETKCVWVDAPVTVAYRLHDGNMSAALPDRFTGVESLVDREIAGVYPGGESRRFDRQKIIYSHVRPVLLDSLEQGEFRQAISLYLRTLPWGLRLGRYKYLIGFWFRFLSSLLPKKRAS